MTLEERTDVRRNLISPPFQIHPAYPKKINSSTIVEDGVKNLRAYRVFRDNTARINHMDYSHDGKFLITSSDDDSMVVYDCDKGTKLHTVNSKKYGTTLIQFTFDNKSVLHGSSKVDHTIRYLNIENKQYVRYFVDHKNRVRSLSMSPVDECFLSCSLDNTMKLWDLRAANCQANLKTNSPAVASFDRDGMVFGVALASKTVKLFDIRYLDRGPFSSINLPHDCHSEVSNIQFSPNNKLVAIGTRSDEFYLVDTFENKFLHKLHGHQNIGNLNLKPSFAPGSKHVFCGSTDGCLNVYSVATGEVLYRYRTDHPSPIENALFSRRYFMLFTSCTELKCWLPATPEHAAAKTFNIH